MNVILKHEGTSIIECSSSPRPRCHIYIFEYIAEVQQVKYTDRITPHIISVLNTFCNAQLSSPYKELDCHLYKFQKVSCCSLHILIIGPVDNL